MRPPSRSSSAVNDAMTRWLLVALGLALYVLLDIADSGHLDGGIARHALSFIFGPHS